jgi:hypothetical protein
MLASVDSLILDHFKLVSSSCKPKGSMVTGRVKSCWSRLKMIGCDCPNHDSFHISSMMDRKSEPLHGKVFTRWKISP